MPANGSNAAFLKSFEDLAYSSISERNPNLMRYYQSFKMLDKNEEGNRAAAVMGFKVGKMRLYVPCFFINGQLKGVNLLYAADIDLFLPATEEWIDYIIHKQPLHLGSMVSKDQFINELAPDLSVYRKYPYKYASEQRCNLPRFFKFAGQKVLAKFLTTLKANEKFANEFLNFYKLNDLNVDFTKKASHKELAFIYPNDMQASYLNDNQKQELIKNGVYVLDKRADHSIVVKEYDANKVIANPTDNGYYDVLINDGTFKRTLIIRNPIGSGPDTVLGITDDNKAFLTKNNKVWTDQSIATNPWNEKLDKGGSSPKDLTISDYDTKEKACYVFTDGKNYTIPYYVSKKKESNGVIVYCAHEAMGSYAGVALNRPDSDININQYCDCYSDHIVIGVNEDNEIKHNSGNILLPEDAKAIKVTPGVKPGSDYVLDEFLKRAGFEELMIKTSGEEIKVISPILSLQMSKAAAFKHLIEDEGLSAHDASQLLSHPGRYCIKYAQDTISMPVSAPPLSVDTASAYSFQNPQLMQNAAALGRKDVFDISVIGNLVNAHDVDSLINEYYPDMLLGLDRVGRLLFLYYWHNDEFRERYGKEDIRDIEDKLSDVFKSLGDLIFYIKERSILPDKELLNVSIA